MENIFECFTNYFCSCLVQVVFMQGLDEANVHYVGGVSPPSPKGGIEREQAAKSGNEEANKEAKAS